MRTKILFGGMFAALASCSLPAAAGVPSQPGPYAVQAHQQLDPRWDSGRARPIRARLMVDGHGSFLRPGDRLRVRFASSEDAHVAILHIDPDGNLDFLFPHSPWDDDFIRGGRTHSLPRGYQAGLPVRSRSGIGYIYMIASPVPLDYRHFAHRAGSWDWSYGGRAVTGDPFWAMEQISRLLVPGWRYVPYAVDYYSYHVGSRHRYPTYACSNSFTARGGWGWSASFGGCDRMDRFLREQPYYYDTVLYRGDRRSYVQRTYASSEAEHRFKEAPGRESARGLEEVRFRDPPAAGRVGATERAVAPENRVAEPARRPAQTAPEPRAGTNAVTATDRENTTRAGQPEPVPASRERPTLERRPSSNQPGARPAPTPARERPEPSPRTQERPAPTPAPERRAVQSNGEQRSAPAPSVERREAPRERPTPARESGNQRRERERAEPDPERI